MSDDIRAEYERLSKIWDGFLKAVGVLATETDPLRVRAAAAEVSQRLPAALGARIDMVTLMPLELRRRELETAPLRELAETVAELAPQKPAVVLPGQRWRCVGFEGVLVAIDVVDGAVALAPYDAPGVTTVRAREVDMRGLKEWSYVGGGE